ncbi:unnamed protein product [Sympodiomycopsis kandeliae]
MMRSLRSRASKSTVIPDSSGSESEAGSESGSEQSQDEWQPDPKKKTSTSSRSKRKRRRLSDDSDSDDSNLSNQSDRQRSKARKGTTAPGSKGKDKQVADAHADADAEGERNRSRDRDEGHPAYDENIVDEEERIRLQQEARDAWEQVRNKNKKPSKQDTKQDGKQDTKQDGKQDGKQDTKQDGKQDTKQDGKQDGKNNAPPQQQQQQQQQQQNNASTRGSSTTLNSWLGLAPIPWPTSPASAQVFDRDSLFIGFVYPLESSSTSSLTPILNHLTNVVHPSLPSSIFPSAFSHLDPKRRGSSHDMQAYRVLELKPGRNGLNGPNDFGIEENADDDGEKYSSAKILRLMKEMGAIDCIVIVSRWYGGTNLGPVRFEHIVKCAKEAIRVFLLKDTLLPLISQLKQMDEQIVSLKQTNTNATSVDYEGTIQDVEKATRLINARQKQIQMLQKRQNNNHATSSQGSVPSIQTASQPQTQGEISIQPQEEGQTSIQSQEQGGASIQSQEQGETSTQSQHQVLNSSVQSPMQPPHPSPPIAQGETSSANEQGQDMLAGWDDLA